MNLCFLIHNDNGTWKLEYRNGGKSEVHGPYSRLVDALYERERVKSGATPPFGRWVVFGGGEVEPIRFDGESDEQMHSPSVMQNELLLRDWEYEELIDSAIALGLLKAHEETYSDEFETQFHYAAQQRSIAPFVSDSTDSEHAKSRKQEVDVEERSDAVIVVRPLYKKFPIIFWTLIGALLTVIGIAAGIIN